MRNSVAIAIVNYRSASMVIDCLHSLVQERAEVPGMFVIVADNASNDSSVEVLNDAIRKYGWSEWVKVLRLPCNGGFAYGNNQIIRYIRTWSCMPRYMMLLNPDTLVRRGAISRLVQFLDERSCAAVVGSGLEDEKGIIQPTARRKMTILGEYVRGVRTGLISRLLSKHVTIMPIQNRAVRCDWVSGAAMMVRFDVFKYIGLFDEGYFLYYEELDFCIRALRNGWEVWCVPESRILHREGATTGIKSCERRGKYWYESRRRYFVKHYGWLGLIAADACWATGRVLLNIRRMLGLGGGRFTDDPAMFSYDLLIGDLRAVANKIKGSMLGKATSQL